jgi:hypothetical protein
MMVSTESKLAPNTWETVLLWTVTNTFSILGGILLGAFLNDALWNTNVPQCVGDCISIDMLINNPIQRAFVFGVSIAGIKSLCEWLVFQRWKIKWNGWFLATIIGWTLGVTIAIGLEVFESNSAMNHLLGGMLVGISQWIILRHYLPKASWWIIANVIGCFAILSYIPLGYTFSMMLENSVVFIVTGVFAGILSGVVLSWLLSLSWLEKQ